jgi:hypothetical protein
VCFITLLQHLELSKISSFLDVNSRFLDVNKAFTLNAGLLVNSFPVVRRFYVRKCFFLHTDNQPPLVSLINV